MHCRLNYIASKLAHPDAFDNLMTKQPGYRNNFVHLNVLNEYKVIAITHHRVPLEEVGKYHIAPEEQPARLLAIKETPGISELLYLSTCNRVEFLLISSRAGDPDFVRQFFSRFNPKWDNKLIDQACREALVLEGEAAVRHVFRVASSLDSLVIGEREIITQVRQAHVACAENQLSGDGIRLLMRKVVEASKEVFTQTQISHNPVSVVSLAYRKLRDLQISQDARILIIGAGVTNANMCKYLRKHGFRNLLIFNRNEEKAIQLAEQVNGKGFALDKLNTYREGVDVLISCTASSFFVVDQKLYRNLLAGDTDRKVIIDLAIPADIDPAIYSNFNVHPILIEDLRNAAEENRRMRKGSLKHCEAILQKQLEEFRAMYKIRRVEQAMRSIPEKIKEIRKHATDTVFARELDTLDPQSREVLHQIVNYLEKKYISVPMRMAKDILIEKQEA